MLPILTRPLRSPFEQFEREINRFFDHGWDGLDSAARTAVYPVDIREDDDHVIVEAELPGFTKDQIEVTFDQGILNINASREVEDTDGQKHLAERHYTRAARSFRLPGSVDSSRVEAKLANGVLTLTLPKREEVKPRKIEVK